jgi:chromosome segregation ATPase
MTAEEIERILLTVAENQAALTSTAARADERLGWVAERLDHVGERLDQVVALQARHSADIAEIDKTVALILGSQSRLDDQLSVISGVMRDLADKQLKNEERFAENEKRFAELAEILVRFDARQELLERFVRDIRAETNGYFAETDRRLTALAEAQARAGERMNHTDEQIRALITAQARTDDQIQQLVERNGLKRPAPAKKRRAAKASSNRKPGKKGSKKRPRLH